MVKVFDIIYSNYADVIVECIVDIDESTEEVASDTSASETAASGLATDKSDADVAAPAEVSTTATSVTSTTDPIQETHRFFVIGAMLATVSDVWDKNLNGDFKQLPTRTIGDKTYKVLPVHDVGPEALKVFFAHIHHKVKDLPLKASFATIRDLAVLVDMYNCQDGISIRLGNWIRLLVEEEGYDPEQAGHEDWLFLESVFPEDENVKTAAEKVSLRLIHEISEINEERCTFIRSVSEVGKIDAEEFPKLNNLIGNAKFKDIEVDYTYIKGPKIQALFQARKEALENMLKEISEFCRYMEDVENTFDDWANDWANGFTKSGKPLLCRNRACVDLSLGSFRRTLRSAGLNFVLYDAKSLPKDLSVSKMCKKVISMLITTVLFNPGSAPASEAARHENDLRIRETDFYKGANTGPIVYSHKSTVGMNTSGWLAPLICPVATKLWEVQKAVMTIHRTVAPAEPPKADQTTQIIIEPAA